MDRYQKFISEKARKKRELMGTMFFPRTPVLLLDLSDAQRLHAYEDLLRGLEAINLTTLVIPPKEDEDRPTLGKHIRFVESKEKRTAVAAADFAVVLDGDVSKIWEHGCVPISQLDGNKTADYNPLQEQGNGFYFRNPTKWEVFAAIVRAMETYQFPYDWENLVREILKSNKTS